MQLCLNSQEILKEIILYKGFVYRKDVADEILSNYKGDYLILYDLYSNYHELFLEHITRYQINVDNIFIYTLYGHIYPFAKIGDIDVPQEKVEYNLARAKGEVCEEPIKKEYEGYIN